MLIYIDDNVIQEFSSGGPNTNDIVASLEDLALARRHGKHLLLSSRDSLEFLKDCEQLGTTARNVYRHLFNDYPNSGMLERRFVRRLQITANRVPVKQYREGNCSVLSIPISRLKLSSTADRTVLLAENHLDCEFYSRFGSLYLAQNKLRGISVIADYRGGGGDTTAAHYEYIQNSWQRLCLCILDSDKGFPGASIGETARKVQNRNNPDIVTSEYRILLVRAAENLLSPQIIASVEHIDGEAVRIITTLEMAGHEALKYLNLKKGLTWFDVINQPVGTPAREYWTRTIAAPPFPELLENHLCADGTRTCTQRKECGCTIVPRCGNEILQRAHESVFRCKSLHEIKNMLSDSVISEWEEIGELVAAWCCSSSVLST